MADDYIDYLECLEYGDHLVKEIDKLATQTTLVDIPQIKALVATAMAAVAAELEKQGIRRSDVRVDRQDVAAKSAALRKQIEKFFHHIGALDEDQGYDVEAFFPGGNLGSISTRKPADLAQDAGEILRGFSTSANASLPDASKWKQRLEDAQTALVGAIAGKSSSTSDTIMATADLVAARQEFLTAYNGIAKRLVQAVLIKLGRKDDLRLFFKDLQVNETPRGTKSAMPASPPADESNKDG